MCPIAGHFFFLNKNHKQHAVIRSGKLCSRALSEFQGQVEGHCFCPCCHYTFPKLPCSSNVQVLNVQKCWPKQLDHIHHSALVVHRAVYLRFFHGQSKFQGWNVSFSHDACTQNHTLQLFNIHMHILTRWRCWGRRANHLHGPRAKGQPACAPMNFVGKNAESFATQLSLWKK